MADQHAQRRLAAIMAIDVVGYSRLMEEDEAGTLATLKAHRTELIDDLIAGHGGRVVKLMGDGTLVEFPSVVEAVRCALEIQSGLESRNAEIPKDRRFELRIGVNLGDVIVDSEDLYGDGVNLAARMQEICDSGGVCLSEDAFRQVRGKVDTAFTDGGEVSLKNISALVRVWRWVPDTTGSKALEKPSFKKPITLPDKPSIAVMPFDNLSDDREQEYFADGIAEDVISGLSRNRGFFVIARNSSFTYKGRPS